MLPILSVIAFDEITVYQAFVNAAITPHNHATSAIGRQNMGLVRSPGIQIICI